jgi:CHASE3 domain sensor protein
MPWRNQSRLSRLLRDHAVVNAAFGITLVVIILGTWIAWRATNRLAQDRRRVVHTHEVLGQLDDILLKMADAETGQRGYLLTSEDIYLEPYQAAAVRAEAAVTALDSMVADNPVQVRRLAGLHTAVTGKLGELDRTVELARGGRVAEALVQVRADTGKQLMDSVRAVIGAMQEEERDLLRQRSLTASARYRTVLWCIGLSGAISLLLVGFAFQLVRRAIQVERGATEVIAEQKERLRTTLASIGDAVITTDERGLITGMNAVAEGLTRWQLDQASGRHVDEVFRIIDRYTRQPVPNPALRALQEGVIVGLANSVLLVARDGSDCRWTTARRRSGVPRAGSSVPSWSSAMSPIGRRLATGSARPTAGCRPPWRPGNRHLGARREVGSRPLRRPLRHDPRGIGHGEREYSLDEFVGTVDGTERTMVRDAIAAALKDGSAFDLEIPRPGTAGRWIAVKGRVERDEAGQVVRIPAVIVDITGRKNAERERDRLASELQGLAASLSEADRGRTSSSPPSRMSSGIPWRRCGTASRSCACRVTRRRSTRPGS